MKNQSKIDNKLLQALLDKLIEAGWIEKSCLVESTTGRKGKINTKFTTLGAERMFGFKRVSDVLSDFKELERLQIYVLLEHWNSTTPPPVEPIT